MSEVYCPKCVKKAPANSMFCPDCGAMLNVQSARTTRTVVVTTPTSPGHQIVKVLGFVHGLTVRTRGTAENLWQELKECSAPKMSLTVQRLKRHGENHCNG